MNACNALRHSALAIALALCAAAPQASASSERGKPAPASTKPDPTPQAPAFYFQGLEDQDIDVTINVGSNSLSVAKPPANGVLITDTLPMKYIPGPNFHGTDEIDFLMVTPTGKESMMRAQIVVLPVNDAPSFNAGSGRAHTVREAGGFTVNGWAQSVSAGPLDEVRTQSVAFEARVVDDPAGVVTGVTVDSDGMLNYTLSGRRGVSEWAISLHDSGGNTDGGQDSSVPQTVRIGVGQFTDLAVKVLRPLSDQLGGMESYQILVLNVGKIDVSGARVVDLFGETSADGSWQCVGIDGGECGAASGAGFIDSRVDLPQHSGVLLTVTALRGINPRNVVFVQPPDHVIDRDLSNNESGF